MTNIVVFDVLRPVMISEGLRVQVVIPEGGIIGFDGNKVYVRDWYANQKWKETLTDRILILRWSRNGSIRKKFFHKTQASEEIKKAYTPSKPSPITTEPAVSPMSQGVFI